MNKGIEITIPIHSHIKKMIAFRECIEPFHISIGKCIYSEVIFYNLTRDSVHITHKKENQFNETLTIHLCEKYIREGRFYINDKRINKIDLLLKGIFENKLADFVESNTFNVGSHGDGNIKSSIIKFMEKYHLTEQDITYDGLKKMYFRYRKRDGKNYTRNYHLIPKTNEKPINSALD